MELAEDNSDWWPKPRRITILNDTIGWMTPHCEEMRRRVEAHGDQASLIHTAECLRPGDVAFFLGCTKLVPKEQLQLHKRNLVAHASDLPKGRGFSPLKWLIQEGVNRIPISLIEAVGEVDAGPIYAKRYIEFGGHELLDEMQDELGRVCVAICIDFLESATLPEGVDQQGMPTFYPKRGEEHRRLDLDKSLAEQFHVLRTVDNQRFPAFFDFLGHRYELTVTRKT